MNMTRLALALALLATPALAQQPPPQPGPAGYLTINNQTIPVPAPLLDRMVGFIAQQPYAQAAPIMKEIEAFAAQLRQAPTPPITPTPEPEKKP